MNTWRDRTRFVNDVGCHGNPESFYGESETKRAATWRRMHEAYAVRATPAMEGNAFWKAGRTCAFNPAI